MRKIILSSVAAITLLVTQVEIAYSTGEIKNTDNTKILPLEIVHKFNNTKLPTEVKVEKEEEKSTVIFEDLGLFQVTAYSNHEHSTGKTPNNKSYGITASGTHTIEGRTIAADWNILPKGTKVYIEGIGERIVEDKGGLIKGKKIDIYFDKEEDAINFGRKKLKVYLSEANQEYQ